MLPTGQGGFCVLELNGALDFRPAYSAAARDVYADVVAALAGAEPLAVEHRPLATADG